MPQLASLGHTAERDLTVVYQKDTLNLVISDYFKALYDRGNLRLKLPPSREFKATALTPPPPPITFFFLRLNFA